MYLGNLLTKVNAVYKRADSLHLAVVAIEGRKVPNGPPATRAEVVAIIKRLQTIEHLTGVALAKAKAIEKSMQPPAKALKAKPKAKPSKSN
jgi:hypothetical protein